MILEAKALKLIKIYFYICERYEKDLKYCCERFSNNNKPELTDQEIMTIYIYVIQQEQRFQNKQIHRFANEYLRSWFPKLGSYAAFNKRLNDLSETFRCLCLPLLEDNIPDDCCLEQELLDSMPIITCSGKRSPRVAREIVDKGVCASKGMYYNGVKLHALSLRRPNKLPFPDQIFITPASVNDLTVFKLQWSDLPNRCFWGDKIYQNEDFFENIKQKNNSSMMTPIKTKKGQTNWDKNWNKAADDMYSKAVSSVRQPIESFFNWLIVKTDIQKASRVRSTKGLLTHVFARVAAACMFLVFNP